MGEIKYLPGLRMGNPISVSRIYKDVNDKNSQSYSAYDTLSFKLGNPCNYEICSKIGRGKYSDVFLAVDIRTYQKVVVKVLKPIKLRKIKREVKILTNISNGPNIIQLLDIVQNSETKAISLIFEWIDNVEYKQLYPTLDPNDVKYYMYELLKGLNYAHSMGIIHRDVKPHNFIINPKKRILRIIDWGLAEFYHSGVLYNVRVASRYFKGPELLVNFQCYDYSLDLWSFGCTFAGLIFQQEPFFAGKDNVDQLVKIICVLGSEDLHRYVTKYSIQLCSEIKEAIVGEYPKIDLNQLVNDDNKAFATPTAIDLISKVLRYDHQERLTAEEAMNHAYFDDIK